METNKNHVFLFNGTQYAIPTLGSTALKIKKYAVCKGGAGGSLSTGRNDLARFMENEDELPLPLVYHVPLRICV